MSRSRLLVFGVALALGGVLVRRYLEEQAIEPPPPTAAPDPTVGSAPGNSARPSAPRAELYAEAQRLRVKGRSKMNKAELAAAVAAARGTAD